MNGSVLPDLYSCNSTWFGYACKDIHWRTATPFSNFATGTDETTDAGHSPTRRTPARSAASAGGCAVSARTHGERVRLLPTPCLPRVGAGRVGGERGHSRRHSCASPGRSRGSTAAVGRGTGRSGSAAHPLRHPVIAPARPGREDRHGGERRRDRRARRLQARQAPARRRRRLGAGARADLRAGAALGGERLSLHRGRALLRREPRAGARRLRR